MKNSSRFLLFFTHAVVVAFTHPTTAAPGDADASFNPAPNGSVFSPTPQPDGKILAGGGFSILGGATRNNFGRINADGTLDASFNPDVASPVNCAAVLADGKVFIGGDFDAVGGVLRGRIARLNANGSLDSSFTLAVNSGIGSSSALCALVQPDGKIIVGGSFTNLGGVTRNRIARINTNGTLDVGFNPDASRTSVRNLSLQPDGKIIVGGAFTNVGGLARNRIARLHSDGVVDASFNPDADGIVYCSLVQPDRKIVIGGFFTTVGGMARNRIARLNEDGTVDASFNPDVNGIVYSLAQQTDGKILLGGQFSTVGGMARNFIARINTNGTPDTSFNPNASSPVDSLALEADGRILVGGSFTNIGGLNRSRLARLDNDAATQTLSIFSSSNRVEWLRGGASPETHFVSFEWSTNAGVSWMTCGLGTRIPGGWEHPGLVLPPSGLLRARARTTGGYFSGSSGLLESVVAFGKEINLAGQGVPIVDGDTTPGSADGTDFGSATFGVDTVVHTFTVENTGADILNLSGTPRVEITGAHAEDFTVTVQPAATVAGSGGTTTFEVTFDPSAAGTRTATISLLSDDEDESPYDFSIRGTGLKTTPVITWADPASITYGTALSDTQLNATASTPGSFAYAPAAGAILNAGTNVLRAVFTPTDSASFNGTTQLVSLTVTKTPLTVTADNKERLYGIANPVLTATITGFVNSETLASSGVTGSAALSTTATIDSPTNSYPIVAALGTLTSANYDFTTFLPGALTVGFSSTPDTVRPTLTVKSPAASSTRVFTNVITITGTAKDNRGVALAFVQKGTNDFVVAQGASNWAATVTLDPGTNILSFKVTDTSANSSLTNTRTVFYVVRAPLTVATNGPGRTSYTNQQLLEIGKGYTITATPASGHLFSNWISGDLATVNASRPFIMSSNLALTANFVPNPFTGTQLKGSYSGLYHPMTVNPPHEQSGFFQVTVTTKGTYSGKLYLMGTSYPISGKLNLALAAAKLIKRRNTNDLLVGLQFQLGTNQVSGFVSNQFWNSELFGYRATFDSKTNPATNFLGSYTMLVAGGTNAALLPSGQGVTTLGISRGGSVSLKGNLADGAPAAQKVALAANGQFPLYQSLYRGKGSLLGWVTFASTPSNDTPGLLLWTKKNGASSTFYPGGFTNEALTLGSRYVAPGRGTNAVTFSNSVVVLEGGNLAASLTNDVLLGALHKVTVSTNSTNQLKFTVTASSGKTSGSFLNPATRKKSLLNGVLLQKQNLSGGYFLGTNQGGGVFFGRTNDFPIVFPELPTP